MAAFEGFNEGFVNTEYGKIHYLRREGHGKPIIFLHGVGGSLNSWNKLAPFLPNGPDIYLMDLLGHGKSDAPNMQYDIMVQVIILERFVKELGIKRPLLFGHSYGGWASILYSEESPVCGLVIEDSAGIELESHSRNDTGTKREAEDLIKEAVRIGANEMVVRSAIGNFGRHRLTRAVLSKVSAKTLIIWGENDELVDLKSGEEMHVSIKGSELLVIPAAGHVPHRTKPEIVANALLGFLEKL